MNVTLSYDIAGDQLFGAEYRARLGPGFGADAGYSVVITGGIAPSEAGAASGLSNMLRNLAGAVGTATLSTILTKREQFHSNIIGQSVTLSRDEVRQRIDQMTSYFLSHGVSDPRRRAASGDRLARRRRQAPGADHGLQRRLRRQSACCLPSPPSCCFSPKK